VEYPNDPAAALMFNHVLSIAAFGIVAFVVMFAHPVSHGGRAAERLTAASGGAVTAKAAAGDAPAHLAASK
jgi:hypothetical protein